MRVRVRGVDREDDDAEMSCVSEAMSTSEARRWSISDGALFVGVLTLKKSPCVGVAINKSIVMYCNHWGKTSLEVSWTTNKDYTWSCEWLIGTTTTWR